MVVSASWQNFGGAGKHSASRFNYFVKSSLVIANITYANYCMTVFMSLNFLLLHLNKILKFLEYTVIFISKIDCRQRSLLFIIVTYILIYYEIM